MSVLPINPLKLVSDLKTWIVEEFFRSQSIVCMKVGIILIAISLSLVIGFKIIDPSVEEEVHSEEKKREWSSKFQRKNARQFRRVVRSNNQIQRTRLTQVKDHNLNTQAHDTNPQTVSLDQNVQNFESFGRHLSVSSRNNCAAKLIGSNETNLPQGKNFLKGNSYQKLYSNKFHKSQMCTSQYRNGSTLFNSNSKRLSTNNNSNNNNNNNNGNNKNNNNINFNSNNNNSNNINNNNNSNKNSSQNNESKQEIKKGSLRIGSLVSGREILSRNLKLNGKKRIVQNQSEMASPKFPTMKESLTSNSRAARDTENFNLPPEEGIESDTPNSIDVMQQIDFQSRETTKKSSLHVRKSFIMKKKYNLNISSENPIDLNTLRKLLLKVFRDHLQKKDLSHEDIWRYITSLQNKDDLKDPQSSSSSSFKTFKFPPQLDEKSSDTSISSFDESDYEPESLLLTNGTMNRSVSDERLSEKFIKNKTRIKMIAANLMNISKLNPKRIVSRKLRRSFRTRRSKNLPNYFCNKASNSDLIEFGADDHFHNLMSSSDYVLDQIASRDQKSNSNVTSYSSNGSLPLCRTLNGAFAMKKFNFDVDPSPCSLFNLKSFKGFYTFLRRENLHFLSMPSLIIQNPLNYYNSSSFYYTMGKLLNSLVCTIIVPKFQPRFDESLKTKNACSIIELFQSRQDANSFFKKFLSGILSTGEPIEESEMQDETATPSNGYCENSYDSDELKSELQDSNDAVGDSMEGSGNDESLKDEPINETKNLVKSLESSLNEMPMIKEKEVSAQSLPRNDRKAYEIANSDSENYFTNSESEIENEKNIYKMDNGNKTDSEGSLVVMSDEYVDINECNLPITEDKMEESLLFCKNGSQIVENLQEARIPLDGFEENRNDIPLEWKNDPENGVNVKEINSSVSEKRIQSIILETENTAQATVERKYLSYFLDFKITKMEGYIKSSTSKPTPDQEDFYMDGKDLLSDYENVVKSEYEPVMVMNRQRRNDILAAISHQGPSIDLEMKRILELSEDPVAKGSQNDLNIEAKNNEQFLNSNANEEIKNESLEMNENKILNDSKDKAEETSKKGIVVRPLQKFKTDLSFKDFPSYRENLKAKKLARKKLITKPKKVTSLKRFTISEQSLVRSRFENTNLLRYLQRNEEIPQESAEDWQNHYEKDFSSREYTPLFCDIMPIDSEISAYPSSQELLHSTEACLDLNQLKLDTQGGGGVEDLDRPKLDFQNFIANYCNSNDSLGSSEMDILKRFADLVLKPPNLSEQPKILDQEKEPEDEKLKHSEHIPQTKVTRRRKSADISRKRNCSSSFDTMKVKPSPSLPKTQTKTDRLLFQKSNSTVNKLDLTKTPETLRISRGKGFVPNFSSPTPIEKKTLQPEPKVIKIRAKVGESERNKRFSSTLYKPTISFIHKSSAKSTLNMTERNEKNAPKVNGVSETLAPTKRFKKNPGELLEKPKPLLAFTKPIKVLDKVIDPSSPHPPIKRKPPNHLVGSQNIGSKLESTSKPQSPVLDSKASAALKMTKRSNLKSHRRN